jgi:hypothetical protein
MYQGMWVVSSDQNFAVRIAVIQLRGLAEIAARVGYLKDSLLLASPIYVIDGKDIYHIEIVLDAGTGEYTLRYCQMLAGFKVATQGLLVDPLGATDIDGSGNFVPEATELLPIYRRLPAKMGRWLNQHWLVRLAHGKRRVWRHYL